MKTINVRELRSGIPRLRELLAEEHELLLVSNGGPLARILPAAPRRKLASLPEHRARMPMVKVGSEVLIREERDRKFVD
jgi:antitoxin (DNA-binding transcriptional repressor) of toxin-antitoxin stability system